LKVLGLIRKVSITVPLADLGCVIQPGFFNPVYFQTGIIIDTKLTRHHFDHGIGYGGGVI
jgi:hypothetical protein